MSEGSRDEAAAALARLSHELKTPLVTIKGYAELLLDQNLQPLDPALREWVRRIAVAANRLASLARRIGSEARAEAAWAYARSAVAPGEWLRRALEEVLPLAASRRLEWALDAPENLPAVALDPDAGREVLLELLQNAARATPDGGRIVLSARREVREGRPGVRITVSDSGVGLPEGEEAQAIFERFATLRGLLEHHSGDFEFGAAGLGLGLSMVRGVARAHGGDAWATGAGRDPEKLPGAAIHLWLPCAGGEMEPLGLAPATVARGRLLVLDPDPEGCAILEQALGDAYEVVSVLSAEAALELWNSPPEGPWAGCIFDPAAADVEVDALVRALRSRPETANAPLVGYGVGPPPAIKGLRDLGVDAWLSKPVRARRLIRTIEDARSRRARR